MQQWYEFIHTSRVHTEVKDCLNSNKFNNSTSISGQASVILKVDFAAESKSINLLINTIEDEIY